MSGGEFKPASGSVNPAAVFPGGNMDEHKLQEQQEHINTLKASTRKANAEAGDVETLTDLKRDLSRSVVMSMWLWFVGLFIFVAVYLYSQICVQQLEVPKEVIIAMFTASTLVVGLVGYILKGLFSVKE